MMASSTGGGNNLNNNQQPPDLPPLPNNNNDGGQQGGGEDGNGDQPGAGNNGDPPAAAAAAAPNGAIAAAQRERNANNRNERELHDAVINEDTSRFPINARINHYLRGMSVTPDRRQALEYVVAVQVATSLRNRERMRRSDIEDLALVEYKRIVNEIPPAIFSDAAVQNAMMTKMVNAQTPLNGKQVWDKGGKVLELIRNEYLTTMPGGLNIVDMPSGTTLLDAVNKFVVSKWNEQHPVSSICAHHMFTVNVHI